MTSPEDRAFFESLNKDLSTRLDSSIQKAFKDMPMPGATPVGTIKQGITSDSIKALAKAFVSEFKGEFGQSDEWGVGEGGEGGGGKGGEGGKFSKFLKMGWAFITQSKLTQGAANALMDTVKFGNIIARAASTTQNQQVYGTDLLVKEFEKFSVSLPEVGEIFKMAMKSGAGPLTQSQAKLFATTKLFDANMQSQIDLQAKGVKVLGFNTSEMEELGSDILHLARENGVYADAIQDAVLAMEATIKAQQLMFGSGFGKEYMEGAAKLQAVTAGLRVQDIQSLLTGIGQVDPEAMIKMIALGGMGENTLGLNPKELQELLKTDPIEYQAQMIAIVGRIASESTKDIPGAVERRALLQDIGGLNIGGIHAAQALFETGGVGGIRDALSKTVDPTKKAEVEDAMAKEQRKVSTDLQDAMAANVIATESLEGMMGIVAARAEALEGILSNIVSRGIFVRGAQAAGGINLAGNFITSILGSGVATWLGSRLFGGGKPPPGPASLGLKGSLPPITDINPGSTTPLRATRGARAMKGLKKAGKWGAIIGAGLWLLQGTASAADGSEGEEGGGGDLWDPGGAGIGDISKGEVGIGAIRSGSILKRAKQISDMRKTSTLLKTSKLAMKGFGKTAAKTGMKSALKKIPVLGAVFGGIFGAMRAAQGDWVGAGLELGSGLASTVPGLGTAVSVGIDAGLLARDIHAGVTGRDLGSGATQRQDTSQLIGHSVAYGAGAMVPGVGGPAAMLAAGPDIGSKLDQIILNTSITATATTDQVNTADRTLVNSREIKRAVDNLSNTDLPSTAPDPTKGSFTDAVAAIDDGS